MPPARGFDPARTSTRSGRGERTAQDRGEWRNLYAVHDPKSPEFRAAARELEKRQALRRRVRRVRNWIRLPERKPPPKRDWREVVIERYEQARPHLHAVESTLQRARERTGDETLPIEKAGAVERAFNAVVDLVKRTARIVRGIITEPDRRDEIEQEARERFERQRAEASRGSRTRPPARRPERRSSTPKRTPAEAPAHTEQPAKRTEPKPAPGHRPAALPGSGVAIPPRAPDPASSIQPRSDGTDRGTVDR